VFDRRRNKGFRLIGRADGISKSKEDIKLPPKWQRIHLGMVMPIHIDAYGDVLPKLEIFYFENSQRIASATDAVRQELADGHCGR
jgi:hypothetical protein